MRRGRRAQAGWGFGPGGGGGKRGGQAGAVGAEDGAGDMRLPQGRGLGVGSCSGWLLVCVTAYLIPQLLPALGLANVARILTDTVVPSAPLSHPSPVLLSQAKSLGMLSEQQHLSGPLA